MGTTGTSCTLNDVQSAKSVSATFSLNSYPITETANPSEGGSVSCTPNPVDHGTSSTCTADPETGYSFSSWGGDCSGTTGTSCTLNDVQSAKSVSATFSLNSYPITATASPSEGGSVSCTPNPVDHGTSSTCTADPETGYSFSAWGGDCSGTTGTSCTLSDVQSAKSVTATFSLNSYPITETANPSEGGSVSCTPNPVDHGTSSTCTANPETGYSFSSWGGDCSGTTGTSCTLNDVQSAKSVSATFRTLAKIT